MFRYQSQNFVLKIIIKIFRKFVLLKNKTVLFWMIIILTIYVLMNIINLCEYYNLHSYSLNGEIIWMLFYLSEEKKLCKWN